MVLAHNLSMPLTYTEYLQLDALLALQTPRSDDLEHDETLFIITHQVYELWFKQMIHELDALREAFETNNLSVVFRCLKRILTILKVMVAQMDIIETMSPVSFNSFRERLEASSGFQSAQFREVEFILGVRNSKVFAHYPEGFPARMRLQQRLHERCVWDSFLTFLNDNGYKIPDELLDRDVTQSVTSNERVQQHLIQIYRDDPLLTQVCELLIDLDEGLQEWRYRHVKMVERTIGAKIGTGGSPGAAYLLSTLLKPVFPDMWLVRQDL